MGLLWVRGLKASDIKHVRCAWSVTLSPLTTASQPVTDFEDHNLCDLPAATELHCKCFSWLMAGVDK